MKNAIIDELETLSECFAKLADLAPQIEHAGKLCVAAIRAGGKVMWCGNGGSAADSQHLAAEIVGRYKRDRPAMASIALTVDTSVLTAVANDYSFEDVFARQIEGLGRRGDVLVGISTSGNSPNVVRALEKARIIGLATVALTGVDGGKCAMLADALINVPASISALIQPMHIACGHLICDMVERSCVP